MVDNPDWELWEPKMIPNPDYKGPWKHPMIANPEYAPDDKLHAVCDEECTHLGFELWQVKSGTIFDDIIVTDSLKEAQKFAEETYFKKKNGEKKMEEKAKEVERKAAEDAASEEKEDNINELDDIGSEF